MGALRDEAMATYVLARNYRLIVLRGLFAILFGLAAFIWPTPTLAVLQFFLGLYLLTDGILAASTGLTRYNGSQPWRLLLIEGLLGIGAGVLALIVPGLTALTILYLVAVWAIAIGFVELVSAFRLRAEINNEGFMELSGVLSVVLGAVLVIWPEAATLGLTWLLGAYVLVFGFLLIGLGLQLWDWQRSVGPMPLHFASGLRWHRKSNSHTKDVIRGDHK
jgi:uncharacterized membrane protein HdeD (DUF308 family)